MTRGRLPARRLGAVVGVAAAVACLTACGGTAGPGPTQAPYSALDVATGAAVSTAELAGRPALLTTWATWCEECRDEMPALEALWRDRGSDGLQVVAVNVNAMGPSERTIGQMIAGWGLTMSQWRDPDNRFTSHFGGMGVPMTVLLDADGSVAQVWFGAIDSRTSEVGSAIDRVLDA